MLSQPNQTKTLGVDGLSLAWVTGLGHFEPDTTPGSITDRKSQELRPAPPAESEDVSSRGTVATIPSLCPALPWAQAGA